MAAGAVTLRLLKSADYAVLEARTATVADELAAIMAEKSIPAHVTRLASMFTLFFTESPVTDFATAAQSDARRYARFFAHMRASGVWLAPSGFETAFLSFAHTDADLDQTLSAARAFEG